MVLEIGSKVLIELQAIMCFLHISVLEIWKNITDLVYTSKQNNEWDSSRSFVTMFLPLLIDMTAALTYPSNGCLIGATPCVLLQFRPHHFC